MTEKQKTAALSAIDELLENDQVVTELLKDWAERRGMANTIGAKLDDGLFRSGLLKLKDAIA